MKLKISRSNIFGPSLYSQKEIIEKLVHHPKIQQALEQYYTDDFKNGDAQTDIRKFLKEIVATPSNHIAIGLRKILHLLWYKIFNGIDVQGLDQLQQEAKNKRLIFVPNHRSHLDYLLVSFILNRHDMTIPHIVAGNNLNITGIGHILKSTGAVFMRRTFKNQPLYAAAFSAYLHFLLDHSFPLEVFIEGGRSRTGKNMPPKIGILSMLMEYLLENEERDLHFVPVSIAYERIPEEGSYIRELNGEAKQKESLWELIGSMKMLRHNFGKVYLSFAPTISMRKLYNSYLEEKELSAVDQIESNEFKTMIYNFGMHIMEQINIHTRTSALPVIATALLSEKHPGFRKKELLDKSNLLIELYRKVHPRGRETLVESDGGLEEVINFLIQSGLVESMNDSEDEIFYFRSPNKIRLNIYKNIFVHHFVIPSLIAMKLQQGPKSEESLKKHVLFFERLLRYEFMFPKLYDFQETIKTTLQFLIEKKLIEKTEETFTFIPEKAHIINMLANIIQPFLDSFRVAVEVMLSNEITSPLYIQKLIKTFREKHEKFVLLGQIDSIEGNLTISYRNIIHFFEDEKILASSFDQENRNIIKRGENFENLDRLKEKL